MTAAFGLALEIMLGGYPVDIARLWCPTEDLVVEVDDHSCV